MNEKKEKLWKEISYALLYLKFWIQRKTNIFYKPSHVTTKIKTLTIHDWWYILWSKKRVKKHKHSRPGQNFDPLLMNLKDKILKTTREGARDLPWSFQNPFPSQKKNTCLHHFFHVCFRARNHNLIPNLPNGVDHNMLDHRKIPLDFTLPHKKRKLSKRILGS